MSRITPHIPLEDRAGRQGGCAEQPETGLPCARSPSSHAMSPGLRSPTTPLRQAMAPLCTWGVSHHRCTHRRMPGHLPSCGTRKV